MLSSHADTLRDKCIIYFGTVTLFFYLVIILFAVGWILISMVRTYSNLESPVSHKNVSHGTLIELIWTITPALILMFIAFPSFKLLYLMDEVSDPSMAVLAEGHQWYWSYQYPDFLNNDDELMGFDLQYKDIGEESELINLRPNDFNTILSNDYVAPQSQVMDTVSPIDSALPKLRGQMQEHKRVIFSQLFSQQNRLNTEEINALCNTVRDTPNDLYETHNSASTGEAMICDKNDKLRRCIRSNLKFIDFVIDNKKD